MLWNNVLEESAVSLLLSHQDRQRAFCLSLTRGKLKLAGTTGTEGAEIEQECCLYFSAYGL